MNGRIRTTLSVPSPVRTHISYGGIEEFYDLDRGTYRLVKKRYVIVTEGTIDNYTKRGWWDYVPANAPQWDAT
jgi:hypothetical protein